MKCEGCKFYEFTHTLSSLNEPIWHCRFGLSPYVSDIERYDCISEALSLQEIRREYYKLHPEELQLKLRF